MQLEFHHNEQEHRDAVAVAQEMLGAARASGDPEAVAAAEQKLAGAKANLQQAQRDSLNHAEKQQRDAVTSAEDALLVALAAGDPQEIAAAQRILEGAKKQMHQVAFAHSVCWLRHGFLSNCLFAAMQAATHSATRLWRCLLNVDPTPQETSTKNTSF